MRHHETVRKLAECVFFRWYTCTCAGAHIHTLEQQRVRAQLRPNLVNGGSLQLFHLLRRHGMHPTPLMRRRCAAAVCGYSVSPVRVYMMFFIGGGLPGCTTHVSLLYSQFSPLGSTYFPKSNIVIWWNRNLAKTCASVAIAKKNRFKRILSARTKSEPKGEGDRQRAAMRFWDILVGE